VFACRSRETTTSPTTNHKLTLTTNRTTNHININTHSLLKKELFYNKNSTRYEKNKIQSLSSHATTKLLDPIQEITIPNENIITSRQYRIFHKTYPICLVLYLISRRYRCGLVHCFGFEFEFDCGLVSIPVQISIPLRMVAFSPLSSLFSLRYRRLNPKAILCSLLRL
jgi:hypothetical protein